MDSLHFTIVRQIETLLNNNHQNDGWIPLKTLISSSDLASFEYHVILCALQVEPSDWIEVSSFKPLSVRRRVHGIVLVDGLPLDVKYDELWEYFQSFYPLKQLTMLTNFDQFNGQVQLQFIDIQHAKDFVEQSKVGAVVFVKNHFSRFHTEHPLTCELLETKQTMNRPRKTFSTRLGKSSPSPTVSLVNGKTEEPCIESTASATDQILFCQNCVTPSSMKSSEIFPYDIDIPLRFAYDFYIPDHLLQQTLPCVMISTLNPSCFTIQIQEDAVEFDKFQRQLNQFYNHTEDERLMVKPEEISLNLCVICVDSKSTNKEPIWNRSQILDFDPNDQTVHLFYVDLGTWDEYVPIHRLRHLIDIFQRHMVFSVTCRLANVAPINDETDSITWPEDATNQFLALLEHVNPQVEFLSCTPNGSLQTNVFFHYQGEYVCLNDYLIHVRKAKPTDEAFGILGDYDEQTNRQSIEVTLHRLHPVVALYFKLGEALEQSRLESSAVSVSGSSLSSLSLQPRPLVKLVHVPLESGQIKHPHPLIFVRYQKMIMVPDFNVCSHLKLIDPHYDLETVKEHAINFGHEGVKISLHSNSDLFQQVSPLMETNCSNQIVLYTLDFVREILDYNGFVSDNFYQVIDDVRRVQLYSSDLSHWFITDKERLTSPTSGSNASSQTSPPISQLAFSRRIISTT